MASKTPAPTRSRKLSSVPPPSDTRATEPVSSIAGDQRQHLIAERAYELAAARGFAPGAELDDWLTAEREIDERLGRQPS